MRFSVAFAASIFGRVNELLTIPWCESSFNELSILFPVHAFIVSTFAPAQTSVQGLDQVVAAFGSEWAVLEDGNVDSVHTDNTFSYLWSLYKPYHTRETKLDLLYIGFSTGAMLGYGTSSYDYEVAEAWWQPNRNHTCSFYSNGIWYNIAPDYDIPWRQRTKSESGCLMTFDGETDPDSGTFSQPTHAFNYDPTVRPWYIQALTNGSGWTEPYVFASNGAIGLTATAPLYNTDKSIILGATAADYELSTIDKALVASVAGNEDSMTVFIVDTEGLMISASVPDITTVGNQRVRAKESRNAVVAATANKVEEEYGSWSDASGIEVAVSVPGGYGLYWAMSTELAESHGLTWHVVVAERIDCDIGYYQKEDGKGNVCKKCPRGKTCQGGATLPYPKRGYFSPLKDFHDEAVQCFAEGNCPGGDQQCFETLKGKDNCTRRAKETGDDFGSKFICSQGSSGMLCESCEKGYYYSNEEGCLHCTGNFMALVVFCVVCSVLALASFFLYTYYGAYIAANFPLVVAAIFDTGRMKVIFANSQIIGSIAWSTGVSWPAPFSYFAKVISIFELNIFDVLPLGCIGGLSFYEYVLVQSLCPIALILVLHLTFGRNKNVAQGWSLLVLYIFLPSANLALIRVFKCYDMPDGTSWLTADMSLQCTDQNGTTLIGHMLMIAYATIALVFWGPIVICIFWILLVRHHDMIINYDKEQDHIECPAELKPYKFLFFHYKPECYSAESKECLRRIALMGGVALLSTTGHGNGVENALFGMVLSMSFALLQREQNPWDKPETNALANGFSWVVFFVFFGAYVVITSESQKQGIFTPEVVSWLLILLSFAIFGLALQQQHVDFGKNRELLKLKGQIADFREQVVGIAYAKRTMRAFERQRFLAGDWAMKASELSVETQKIMLEAQNGLDITDIQDDKEHEAVFKYYQDAAQTGKQWHWYWQEDAHKQDKYNVDDMYPDAALEAQEGKIWVQYKKAIMAQLEDHYQAYMKDPSCDPAIRLDLEGRLVEGTSGANGFVYHVDVYRRVQMNERTGFVRPVIRIEKDVEISGNVGRATAADASAATRNIDLVNINSFTNKDGPGTAITLNADRLDAQEINDDDMPPFPLDLIKAQEPVLLIQKGQLIQIQKKRSDGWIYGSVIWEQPSENGRTNTNPKDDRPRLAFARMPASSKIAPLAAGHFDDDNGEGSVANGHGEDACAAAKEDTIFEAVSKGREGDDDDLGGESAGWFPSIFVRPPQMKELKELQDAMGGKERAVDALSPPDTWSEDAKLRKSFDAKLVKLRAGSDEYELVRGQFEKCMGDRRSSIQRIVSISRLENLALWQSYAAKKASMICRAATEGIDSSQYEKPMMYHGTSPDVIPKIAQQGFNRLFAGKNAVRYGKGTYFALTAKYSNNYAQPDANGVKHMFVCRVMVGETSQGRNEQLVPDIRVQETNQMYDSTTDNLHAPEPSDSDPGRVGSGVRQMYVTFHDAQAYPEYLLDFKVG